MKKTILPLIGNFSQLRYPFLGLWLLCFGSLQATTSSNTNEPLDILTFEEYASTFSGESYLMYLEKQLFGISADENQMEAPEHTFMVPAPVEPEPEPCPEIDYVICDDYGPLITNGIVYREMIDPAAQSLPFCLIEGKECFDMDGVSLHGRPTSDVSFDIYNFEFDPNIGCEFNFFFTENTDTRHFKAFIGLCSYTEDGLPTFTCYGDTEEFSSIEISCDLIGESTMPQFWTVVIAGLSWENYAFKIKPDSPCSDDEITEVILMETGEPGVREGTAEGILGLQKNDFVNQTRLDDLGDEIEVAESSLEAADVYGDAYASTGCGVYQGEDRIYSFVVEDGINDVTITLDNRGTGEPLGMFLYNYTCGGQVLDFAEVGAGSGEAQINISLKSGRYYIIVDNDIVGDWGAHKLMIRTEAGVTYELSSVDNVESCPDEQDPNEINADKIHTYTFDLDEVELANDPEYISNGKKPDLFFLAGFRKGDPGLPDFIRQRLPVVYSPLYTTKNPWESGTLQTIQLFEDDTISGSKCGFNVGDSIYIKTVIIPNGENTVDASQLMVVGFGDDVPKEFRPPGRFLAVEENGGIELRGVEEKASLAKELESDPCVLTFFGASPIEFNAFAAEGGPGTVRVQTNRRWEVYKSEEYPWLTIDNEDMGSYLGDAEINFNLDPNNDGEVRYSEFVILGIENFVAPVTDPEVPPASFPDTIFVDTVRIYQQTPDEMELDIAFSDFWIDCDAPRAKLSAIGCIDRPGITSTWEITPIFRGGEEFGGDFREETTVIEGGALIKADLKARRDNEIKLTVEDEITGAKTTIDTIIFVPSTGGPKIKCNIMEVETCTYDIAFMLDLKISGGLEPYSVEWSHGSTATMFPELPAGWYGVTVTDANGCQAKKSLDLEPSDHYCPGGMIGEDQFVCGGPGSDPSVIESLELPFGDDDPSPYQFFWKKSTNLCDNFYSPGQEKWETISGARGETYDPGPITTTTYYRRFATMMGSSEIYPSNVVTVSVVPGVGVSLPSRKTSCDGEPVEITASVSGGTAPFTFSWDNGLGGGATQVVNPHSTTDYNVTVTDANGCTATAESRIAVKPNPTVRIRVDNGLVNLPVACVDAPVLLIADVSLGTTTPTWTTTGAGTLSSTTGAEVVYTPVPEDIEAGRLILFTATTEDIGNACTPATDEIEVRIFSPATEEFCGTPTSGFISNVGNLGQGYKIFHSSCCGAWYRRKYGSEHRLYWSWL